MENASLGGTLEAEGAVVTFSRSQPVDGLNSVLNYYETLHEGISKYPLHFVVLFSDY